VQNEGSRPQYSLGKSFTGFGPTGPWLVTPDELPDRDDLAISCRLGADERSGETMQSGRTSAMIYSVPILIERLSAIITLYPGDIIFTGTPAGVGNARTPEAVHPARRGAGELDRGHRRPHDALHPLIHTFTCPTPLSTLARWPSWFRSRPPASRSPMERSAPRSS
jgi:2-keto-4-pentenoate hydratase/2-oxohepta-3-ene-1,7-dioic acid hydratase in catechol pathway